jgi:hypothetical protein
VTADSSTIFLLDPVTDEPIEAELVSEIASNNIIDWHTKWQPALGALKATLQRLGVPRDQWPQSAHWDWSRKVEEVEGLLAFRNFSVIAEGLTQGLMRLDLTKSARLAVQLGKPIVYVDYVEVAPWNQPFGGLPARYRGVGSALIIAAVNLSMEEDFKGRIGLHSLPQSEGFYRHLNMADLGPDRRCQGLHYFEMTPDAAKALLEKE